MNHTILSASAGFGAIAATVSAILFLGCNSASDTPAAQAQISRPSQSPVDHKKDASGGAATISPTVEDLYRVTIQPVQVVSYESTAVYAKASGFLKNVEFDIGDRVEKDQILAELLIPEMDQELAQKAAAVEQAGAAVEQARARSETAGALVTATEAQLAEAQASIAQHEAELVFRRAEYKRIAELVKSRSVTEALQDEKLKHLQTAEAARAAAQAHVKSAEARVQVEQSRQREAKADLSFAQTLWEVADANLEQTRVLMKYAQIRAPYDGLITRRWIDSGDFVASAANSKMEPLFTVDRIDRLRLVFDIPESESALIQIGQPTSLVVDALKNRTFAGRIKRTTGVLDPQTRTLRVEAELDEPSESLRPGMYGMIIVTLVERPQVLTVPTRCIQYENGSPYVVCTNDGRAEKRAVKVGYSDNLRTEIVEGAEPSDVIVSEAGDYDMDLADHRQASLKKYAKENNSLKKSTPN
ncbi:MAG: efflux RND transporter periplasmic adaptor subunit [Planctomycetota bacterium]|nr:efflux RND transporter periplasmic adaptor subunit [Planctomycetota bacterium]MDA1213727.1 efflux RND transporter periplasmic adaptor subunit [Planctomycetota bacterium]